MRAAILPGFERGTLRTSLVFDCSVGIVYLKPPLILNLIRHGFGEPLKYFLI